MTNNNTNSPSSRFPELTVSGSSAQMGQGIGEHFRNQIVELSELTLERFNKGSKTKISWDQAERVARLGFDRIADYFPDSLAELHATAQAAGVSFERLMILNGRNMLSEAIPQQATGTPEGCTSIMVTAGASQSGTGFAGQNWDNDPMMSPLSAVITRKGTGKATFTSWTQPGLIAYMGFNSAGLGVCMNALNGPADPTGVPWYFLIRAILESNSVDEATAVAESTPRALTGNAAMITNDGPINLEITPTAVRALGADSQGFLVHTNHCVHPSLESNNDVFPERIYGQSFERRDRGQELLEQRMKDGRVSLGDAKAILSDHDGYPTSICRHPNDHPSTGWQRSVISIIFEPSEQRMHVSNGNPCENEYEIYSMG